MKKFNNDEFNGIITFLKNFNVHDYDFYVEENRMDGQLNIMAENKDDESEYFFHTVCEDLEMTDELERILNNYTAEPIFKN